MCCGGRTAQRQNHRRNVVPVHSNTAEPRATLAGEVRTESCTQPEPLVTPVAGYLVSELHGDCDIVRRHMDHHFTPDVVMVQCIVHQRLDQQLERGRTAMDFDRPRAMVCHEANVGAKAGGVSHDAGHYRDRRVSRGLARPFENAGRQQQRIRRAEHTFGRALHRLAAFANPGVVRLNCDGTGRRYQVAERTPQLVDNKCHRVNWSCVHLASTFPTSRERNPMRDCPTLPIAH